MSEVNDLIRQNAQLSAELAEIKKIHTDLMLVTNSQLAEIERLRAENKRLTEENERLDAEIYSLYYAQSMADRYA